MKIAFEFVCDETLLFAAVGERLKEEGHTIVGLTLGQRWKNAWMGRFSTFPISTVPINNEVVKVPVDLTREIERIEREYGAFHPSSFLHADRFLCELNRRKQMIALVDAFKSIEHFFENEAPDIYFCTPIAYLFNLVTHAVCKRIGIPHISLYTTRGATPRFTYSTNVSCTWHSVKEEYERLISGRSSVDRKAVDAARRKLELFRHSPHAPHYMNRARANYNFRSVFVKEFFTRLKYYYLDGWGWSKSDYMTKTPSWYAWRDMKKLVRAKIISKCRKYIFDSVEEDVPYYLFPLPTQPEASTLIRSEWYTDLLSTIQNISRCIPFGAYLYLKEHTSAFGRRSLNFYRDIKKLHNVRLLGPWEDRNSLIIKSQGVIILSSTMGWESLLHGKPTYVLGSLFCNDLSRSIKVGGYNDLRHQLLDDYRKGGGPIVPDESLVAFLVAIQAGSFPGLIAAAKMEVRKAVLSEENVQLVTEGLKQIIERVGTAEAHKVF